MEIPNPILYFPSNHSLTTNVQFPFLWTDFNIFFSLTWKFDGDSKSDILNFVFVNVVILVSSRYWYYLKVFTCNRPSGPYPRGDLFLKKILLSLSISRFFFFSLSLSYSLYHSPFFSLSLFFLSFFYFSHLIYSNNVIFYHFLFATCECCHSCFFVSIFTCLILKL